jgi:hypothetical protein
MAKKEEGDAKARALARLRDAGATSHSLLILSEAAEGESLADSQDTVEVEVEAEQALVWVNGIPVQLNNGEGSIDLLPGHHILSFEVRGTPNSEWAVKITSPKEAKSEDGDRFDGSGFDAGRIKFVVNP